VRPPPAWRRCVGWACLREQAQRYIAERYNTLTMEITPLQ
jgi:hypothetical protein